MMEPDYRGFARTVYERLCDGRDMDMADAQDWLADHGIVEERETDLDTNEWGADRLCFWVELPETS